MDISIVKVGGSSNSAADRVTYMSSLISPQETPQWIEGQRRSPERLDTVAWVKGVKESGSVSPVVHVSLGVAASAVRPVGLPALG